MLSDTKVNYTRNDVEADGLPSDVDKMSKDDIDSKEKLDETQGHVTGVDDGELTLFERKAALINAEIDKFGFGRYQQCIWLLCGFGYFIDLAWAKGVGLMATAVFIGAISVGIITDIIGRKWAFNITCLITSIFGMLMAASKYNYDAICGIYFLCSIGLGGNIPIDALIALEFMPQNKRYLVSLLTMWQSIGVTVACALAYATAARYRCDVGLPACTAVEAGAPCCTVESNMGWRYLTIIIGSMTLTIFVLRFFVFRFYESPKFLVSKGQEQAAIDVLHKIARFNKAPPPTLTIDDFRRIDLDAGIVVEPAEMQQTTGSHAKNIVLNAFHSLKFIKGLFAKKMTCFVFALLAVAYCGNYWSFTLAGYFLPIVLLRNNVDSGSSNITQTYQQYILIYLPGILGAIIALFSVQLPIVGRKWSLVIAASLQGLAMAMYTQVATTAGYVGLNALAYIMQTYFNAVLYASAPELFPTTYRATATGMLSCLGRISGIMAPFAGQQFIDEGRSSILWLGAGGIWLAALTMCFLPIEMRNRQMY